MVINDKLKKCKCPKLINKWHIRIRLEFDVKYKFVKTMKIKIN